MSSSRRACIVAASIQAVHVLKDQGLCRWNNAMNLLQQHAKTNIRSYAQAKRLSAPSSTMVSNKLREEKLKHSEESLRQVMYLSCWGPN